MSAAVDTSSSTSPTTASSTTRRLLFASADDDWNPAVFEQEPVAFSSSSSSVADTATYDAFTRLLDELPGTCVSSSSASSFLRSVYVTSSATSGSDSFLGALHARHDAPQTLDVVLALPDLPPAPSDARIDDLLARPELSLVNAATGTRYPRQSVLDWAQTAATTSSDQTARSTKRQRTEVPSPPPASDAGTAVKVEDDVWLRLSTPVAQETAVKTPLLTWERLSARIPEPVAGVPLPYSTDGAAGTLPDLVSPYVTEASTQVHEAIFRTFFHDAMPTARPVARTTPERALVRDAVYVMCAVESGTFKFDERAAGQYGLAGQALARCLYSQVMAFRAQAVALPQAGERACSLLQLHARAYNLEDVVTRLSGCMQQLLDSEAAGSFASTAQHKLYTALGQLDLLAAPYVPETQDAYAVLLGDLLEAVSAPYERLLLGWLGVHSPDATSTVSTSRDLLSAPDDLPQPSGSVLASFDHSAESIQVNASIASFVSADLVQSDPYKEFFIRPVPHPFRWQSDGDVFWSGGFEVVLERCPLVLRDTVDAVLEAGKLHRLLKDVYPSHPLLHVEWPPLKWHRTSSAMDASQRQRRETGLRLLEAFRDIDHRRNEADSRRRVERENVAAQATQRRQQRVDDWRKQQLQRRRAVHDQQEQLRRGVREFLAAQQAFRDDERAREAQEEARRMEAALAQEKQWRQLQLEERARILAHYEQRMAKIMNETDRIVWRRKRIALNKKRTAVLNGQVDTTVPPVVHQPESTGVPQQPKLEAAMAVDSPVTQQVDVAPPTPPVAATVQPENTLPAVEEAPSLVDREVVVAHQEPDTVMEDVFEPTKRRPDSAPPHTDDYMLPQLVYTEGYQRAITFHCRLTQMFVIKHLLDDCCLLDHLRLVGDLFFLLDPSFKELLSGALLSDPADVEAQETEWQTLQERPPDDVREQQRQRVRALCLHKSLSWPPRDAEVSAALKNVLSDCLGQSSAASVLRSVYPDLDDRVGFVLRKERLLDQSDDASALDFLSLEYRPPGPINIVLSPGFLAGCDEVLNHLLRLMRMSTVTRTIYRQSRYMMSLAARVQLPRGASDGAALLATLRRMDVTVADFRLLAQHLVSSLWAYAQEAAIGETWSAFLANINENAKAMDLARCDQDALDSLLSELLYLPTTTTTTQGGDVTPTSVRDLHTHHTNTIHRITFRCLLHTSQHAAHTLITGAFNLILAFGDLVATATSARGHCIRLLRALSGATSSHPLRPAHTLGFAHDYTLADAQAVADRTAAEMLEALAAFKLHVRVLVDSLKELDREPEPQRHTAGLADLLVRLDFNRYFVTHSVGAA
ncbi:hypothetical protein RI367_005852 [Sorochytrium milnesiophthora]